ncbi:hypothetical protein H5410_037278, partial [Solanum commersonii]
TSYTLFICLLFYGFQVWIYEVFPHLEKYAEKSLDTPLLISHLLRWHISKIDNIVEGDPFKYKERITKIVHQYLTSTVCGMEQYYMTTFKPYTNEVKDTITDALKAQLKCVTVLTSGIESAEDEYLDDHNLILPCENSISSGQKNVPSTFTDGNLKNLRERIVSLEQSIMKVVAYILDEKLRKIKKNKKSNKRKLMKTMQQLVKSLQQLMNTLHMQLMSGMVVDEVADNLVDEVVVDVVDKVAVDEVVVDVVDEVAIDDVDKVTVDEVASDLVDEVAVDVVDEVTCDVVDKVTIDVVDEVAGNEAKVDEVEYDVVDEVVAGDAIDEVAEEKKEEEKNVMQLMKI